ncbi:MAG TPA: lysylphosphatidylglycerol synthase transmembrane domain-containing protein [Candidatus Saccharimonadales bacterium]|nr:lysylphosphatidylglycerol synthase transmembrane domain-containing protein [Candidatus Saccharimonadales bacterium]
MSFRAWVSIVTLFLIAVIIYFSRHELLHAWQLLERVNIWILLLLIPGQILVYYANGEMIFSYLRAKNSIDNVKGLELARMSLEMNFVNHILPSGGVSGVSYMTWRLGKYGVPPGRAAMAQVVKFAMGFVAFIALLLVAVLAVTIDGSLNRWIILVSSTMVAGMVAAMVAGGYLLNSATRTGRFADWIVRMANRLVYRVTFGKRRSILKNDNTRRFFSEMHHDYVALKADKAILVKPFLWGLVFTAADALLFWLTFLALGTPVNPAPILIAYGVASMAAFFVATPGGAGAYEAIMVAFLAVAGLSQGVAIAGIVLTRVILLLGTILFGYLFYQHAIIKYGRRDTPSQIKR